MGEVWAGTNLMVGVRVAIKRLLPAGTHNHESLARFKREAQLLGRVNSEYVARVVDFVEDPQYGLVLIMELVEGPSLYNVLNQRKFSIEEAIDLGCDILSGLSDLHDTQIVHRDLKPGNIIIEQRTRGRQRARIVDFGMSRIIQSGGDDEEEMTGITRADVALGTLEYMAPEQMLNSRGVTGAADIYAAGVILYRAVAGHHAYRADSDGGLVRSKLTMDAPPLPSGRDDSIARAFEAVVAKALQRKPQDRYASASEMLRDLEQLRSTSSLAPGAPKEPSISVEFSRSMVIPEEGTPAGSAVFSPIPQSPRRPAQPEDFSDESQLMPIPLARPPSRSLSPTTPAPAPPSPASETSRSLALLLAAVVGGILVGALAMYASKYILAAPNPQAPTSFSTPAASP
jgi:serine/threonine-protein kinase